MESVLKWSIGTRLEWEEVEKTRSEAHLTVSAQLLGLFCLGEHS